MGIGNDPGCPCSRDRILDRVRFRREDLRWGEPIKSWVGLRRRRNLQAILLMPTGGVGLSRMQSTGDSDESLTAQGVSVTLRLVANRVMLTEPTNAPHRIPARSARFHRPGPGRGQEGHRHLPRRSEEDPARRAEGVDPFVTRATGPRITGGSPLTDAKTDKAGAAPFALADGGYYVDIASDKELPYLDRPVGFKQPAEPVLQVHQGREGAGVRVQPGRRMQADTAGSRRGYGRGHSGRGVRDRERAGRVLALQINGDNLGARQVIDGHNDESLKTDKDGNFVRYMGARDGYTYYVWTVPKVYDVPAGFGEVELKTPVGTEKVEHVFKLRKKK